ncbi:MAG: hypothetical protein AMXMBFR58_11250 [Phycisphaerae bacterium]
MQLKASLSADNIDTQRLKLTFFHRLMIPLDPDVISFARQNLGVSGIGEACALLLINDSGFVEHLSRDGLSAFRDEEIQVLTTAFEFSKDPIPASVFRQILVRGAKRDDQAFMSNISWKLSESTRSYVNLIRAGVELLNSANPHYLSDPQQSRAVRYMMLDCARRNIDGLGEAIQSDDAEVQVLACWLAGAIGRDAKVLISKIQDVRSRSSPAASQAASKALARIEADRDPR